MFKGHGGYTRHLDSNKNNGILDFSANINPLGYPAGVRKKIIENFDEILHYPDIDCSGLRKYISKKIGLSENEILIGNGSTELFYLIPRALHPKKGIIFQPAFSEFAEAFRCSHTETIHHVLDKEEGFCFHYKERIFRENNVEMAFICNPNNPTGQVAEKDTLITMAKRHPDVIFVIDEAFIDFVDEPDKYGIAQEAASLQNIIIVRSLTKFYGFPGLRVGYLIAHADIIKKLTAYKEPWTVNIFAQFAVIEAMKDKTFVAESRKYVIQEQKYLYNELAGIKELLPFKPSANFIFVRINSDSLLTSTSLHQQLQNYGIIIRDCSNFTGLSNKYFRVAVRTHDENIQLVHALQKAFDKKRYINYDT